jgi:cobalamin biosynthetic protein CobC
MSFAPSDNPAFPIHGGGLKAAEDRFGVPPSGWLDLSTGINPFAYPVPDFDSSAWAVLPGDAQQAPLTTAAARVFGTGEERIVLAPGTQAIIQTLPYLRPPAPVAIVGPTYPGHATSWSAAGHTISMSAELDDVGDCPVVIICNPNNPDGRRFDPEHLIDIASERAGLGGLVVVDESFGDLVPELSLAAQGGPALLVLKSFGKFFGLAGLRLGFAIADPPIAALLRDALGPWPVSGPAIAIGVRALADADWIAGTRTRLEAEAAALDEILIAGGLAIVGGTNLFRLTSAARAWALYEHLGKRGILTRAFAEQPRWLRFGLPPDESARRRLAGALAEWEG